MGRWLDALKKYENAENESTQNPQKCPQQLIGGNRGEAPEAIRAFSEAIPSVAHANPKTKPSNVVAFRPHVDPMNPQPGDAWAYAKALRHEGPCGYGAIATTLGWSASRASAAESELRKAGRIQYDHTGRGTVVEIGERQ